MKRKAKKIERKGFRGPDGLMISILNFKDHDMDKKFLKGIAEKIGPFSIVGGTTKLDIPRFLRDKHYKPYPKEASLRTSMPELFCTYEIYVTSEKIERRTISHERNNKGYFNCDDIDGKVEKTPIDNPLQKYTFS